MSNRKNLTYIDKNGYKRYCDSNKLVHRHVAEIMKGRKLRPGEVLEFMEKFLGEMIEGHSQFKMFRNLKNSLRNIISSIL